MVHKFRDRPRGWRAICPKGAASPTCIQASRGLQNERKIRDMTDTRNRTAFAQEVRARGQGVLEAYLETRDRSDAMRSVKNSVEQATGAYGGRFLIELIQNAHDAHPSDRSNGEILLHVDESEGPHGTLYAADRGTGFATKNFRAISNLAVSSKEVGDGIGNKGVGFKSVLQVCEAPEIYSADPDQTDEDGFCFRFANENDLRAMLPDPTDLDDVLENVSRYTIPVPIGEVPATVSGLRTRGYTTVLRLPLHSANAFQETRRRFSELRESTVPVSLFLDRISDLSLTWSDRDGVTEICRLRRDATRFGSTSAGLSAAVADLGQGEQFLIVNKDVDPSRLRSALENAVAARRLQKSWLKWESKAQVSIAVPFGGDVAHSRLYTYLPMGEDCPAPLHGHLHAPFFTDYSRTGMDWEHPLNDLLIKIAAELALEAAGELLKSLIPTPSGEPQTSSTQYSNSDQGIEEFSRINAAAVDLVSWTPQHAHYLDEVTADNTSGTAARRGDI